MPPAPDRRAAVPLAVDTAPLRLVADGPVPRHDLVGAVLPPTPPHGLPVAVPRPAAPAALGRALRRVRAWMLVLPVDAALLLAPLLWAPQQRKAIATMALLSLLLLTGGHRHRARLHLGVLDELPSLVGRMLTAGALVATVIALRHEQEAVTTFLVNAAISIGLVVVGRVLTTQVVAWARRRRLAVHPTVLIGGGPLAAELAHVLLERPAHGLWVVGFVDDGAGSVAEAVVPRIGHLDELDRVVVETGADVLLVADGDVAERRVAGAVRSGVCTPCDLLVVPRLPHFATHTGPGDRIGSVPVVRIRTPNLHGALRAVKRASDVVAAALALVLSAPLLALCALAVRLEGGPGVLFRQVRVGRHGVLFDCLKFRTVRPADDLDPTTQWTVDHEGRVGPVGRFLRRTSLDELPQLWNILRGDMALVGPRPERPHFVDKFSAEVDRYAHRHRVEAGLTGLAQVSGLRGDTSIADRARYDNYYIEHWSLWLDVKIVLRTLAEVLFARGR
jgi:exopolysaccharide biosynthesis polyprenyl glycosylphosphotransferase